MMLWRHDRQGSGGVGGAEASAKIVGVGHLVQDEEEGLVLGDDQVVEVVLGKVGERSWRLTVSIGTRLMGWLEAFAFHGVIRPVKESRIYLFVFRIFARW